MKRAIFTGRSFSSVRLAKIRSLCSAVVAGFIGCASPSPHVNATAPTSSAAPEYSLTQRSASRPDRAGCKGAGCSDDSTPNGALGRCDAEICEGDLSETGIAELRAAAVKASDCYETELKDKHQLEGKMTVRLRLAAGREPCEIRIEQNSLQASETFAKCVIARLGESRARPSSGCVDLALPLAFVRQEVEAPA
jgi:hypothetical protein